MGEIRRERVFGNFKNRSAVPPKPPKLKQRPGMSEEHLALIRALPCCRCNAPPKSEAHHLKQGIGERGMGLRSTDRWAVPLCRSCHDEVERIGSRNEIKWFFDAGIDPHELARGLWSVSGDYDHMLRVLMAHKEFCV